MYAFHQSDPASPPPPAPRLGDHPPHRRTAPPGCADGAEEDRSGHQTRVGIVEYDHGIVAAEFEQRPAEALGDSDAHPLAHVARAGGRDERDTTIVDEQLADVAAAAGDEVEHPFKSAAG